MTEKITVQVIFHSTLVQYASDGKSRKDKVSLPARSTIADLIAHLKMPHDPIYLLLALNGEVTNPNQILKSGNKIHLMLPISGG